MDSTTSGGCRSASHHTSDRPSSDAEIQAREDGAERCVCVQYVCVGHK